MAAVRARQFGQIRRANIAVVGVASLAVAFIAAGSDTTPSSLPGEVSGFLPHAIADSLASLPQTTDAEPTDAPRKIGMSHALLAALDDYARMASNRAGEQSDFAESNLTAANAAMQSATKEFFQGITGRVDRGDLKRAIDETKEYATAGARMVQAADEQRIALKEYSVRCESMRGRVRGSLESGWKVFGRVVARPSLMNLKRQIDDLSDQSTSLVGVTGSELDAISESLAIKEGVIAETLDSERGLAEAQGEQWITQMRQDLAALAVSRANLKQMDIHRVVLIDRFKRLRTRFESLRLEEAIPAAPMAPSPAVPMAPSLPVPGVIEVSADSDPAPIKELRTKTKLVVDDLASDDPIRDEAVWLLLLVTLGGIAVVVFGRAKRVAQHDGLPTETQEDGSPDFVPAASMKLVEQRLRGAFARGELELVFQPEIDTNGLEVELLDVRVHWWQPSGQLVSLGDLPAAVKAPDLVEAIGEWMLRSAVETAARWHHGSWPQVRLAVGLSSGQLAAPEFLERLKAMLDEHQLPARCIEIVLTESVLRSGTAVPDVLHKLRMLGTSIALEDFGTGYVQFADLKMLPLTRIKLDRMFANDVDMSACSDVVSRSIIGLSERLGLQIGTEPPEHLDSLLEEKGVCAVRHFICSDQTDEIRLRNGASLIGSSESSELSYRSSLTFRASFFLMNRTRAADHRFESTVAVVVDPAKAPNRSAMP